MRSSHSLVAAGCIALGVFAVVLALVASVARATNLPQTTPPVAATSVAVQPTTAALPLTLVMNVTSVNAAPGSDIVFELSLRSAPSNQVYTRSFISGPAEVVGVQAVSGSCHVGNPVVCEWSLGKGSGRATIIAHVADDAAPGTTISAQSLAQDSAQYSAASGLSSLQVSAVQVVAAPTAKQVGQAATPTSTTIVTAEGTPAQATATALPATAEAATARATIVSMPDPASSTGALPDTGTLPPSPIVGLGLAGSALLFVGVRRIRAADRHMQAQRSAVRKLGTIVSAIGYLQRRTRIAADEMAAHGEAMAHKLDNHTRR